MTGTIIRPGWYLMSSIEIPAIFIFAMDSVKKSKYLK